jgi:hypothetical protein
MGPAKPWSWSAIRNSVPILKLLGIPTRAMDLGEKRASSSSIFADLIDAKRFFDKIPLAKGGILGYNPVIDQESNPTGRFARGTYEP